MTRKLKQFSIGNVDNLEEEKHIKGLVLVDTFDREVNNTGKQLKWYGARLRLLRTFYNRSANQVAESCFTNGSLICCWELNKLKPSKERRRQLALYFEVPEDFFSKDEISIKLIQQLNIEII